MVQLDTPEKLCESPANAFVYDFLGEYNTFGSFFSRPYETIIDREPQNEELCVRAKISLMRTTGHFARIELESESGCLYIAEVARSLATQLQLKIGEWVWIRPSSYKTFDAR